MAGCNLPEPGERRDAMATLTAAPALPQNHEHPVPWRRMARVTWLQRRGALLGLLLLFTACALAIVLEQFATGANYARYVADGCVVRPIHVPCGTIYNAIHAGTDAFASLVVVLQLFPVVIGVFVGAPLLSREFESGTFRFTWTQGVGRTRFVITTLIFLAGLTMAAACILGLLLGWYAHPFEVIGAESQWQSGLFNATGFTLAAWTLFALVLGTFLGAVTGRTVTAMAATLVAVAGIDPTRWLLARNALWVNNQPTDRLWLFQGAEGTILIGLAALLGLATLWVVRHRT